MDLSIVLPTLNRSFFIDKLLKYYESFNFSGKIIIIDSSSKTHLEKNIQRVNQSFLNILHIKLISDEFYAMKIGLNYIKTNYAVHSGDDDFFSISGLSEMVDFLNNKQEYICVNGKSFVISYNTKTKTIKGSSYYDMPYYDDASVIKRLNSINKYNQLPVYTVYRTKYLKKIYDNLLTSENQSIKLRRCFNEYMWKILPPLLGRGYKLKDKFYLVRFQTDIKYMRDNILEIKDQGFDEIHEECINKINSFVNKEYNNSKIIKLSNKIFQSIVDDNLNISFQNIFFRKIYKLKLILIYIIYRLIYRGKKLHQNYLDTKNEKKYLIEMESMIKILLN